MSGKCDRSGMCCSLIMLPVSPDMLRGMAEAYTSDPNHPLKTKEFPERTDEVYRMLGDRHIGYSKKMRLHLYGPCRNLYYTEENGKRVANCAIQSVKPEMCRSFPYDGRPEDTINPSQYKKCGFNVNKRKGFTKQTIYETFQPQESKCDTLRSDEN